jgi:hypothetical protein
LFRGARFCRRAYELPQRASASARRCRNRPRPAKPSWECWVCSPSSKPTYVASANWKASPKPRHAASTRAVRPLYGTVDGCAVLGGLLGCVLGDVARWAASSAGPSPTRTRFSSVCIKQNAADLVGPTAFHWHLWGASLPSPTGLAAARQGSNYKMDNIG